MSTIQIAYRLKDLTQLTGYRRLTSTRITRQHDMDTRFLLFTKSPLSTLHTVLDAIGNLTDCLLHLIHTNILVKIAKDVVQGTLFRNIATNISLFYHRCVGTTADKRGEDILCRLHGKMTIAESIILDFYLILEIAFQLMLRIGSISGNAIFNPQLLLTNLTQFAIAGSRKTEDILETVLCRRVIDKEIIQTLRKT